MSKVKQEAGNRYGRLLVVSESGRDHKGQVTWNCLCDCGQKTVVQGFRLRRNDGTGTRSCGCKNKEHMQALAEARMKRNSGPRQCHFCFQTKQPEEFVSKRSGTLCKSCRQLQHKTWLKLNSSHEAKRKRAKDLHDKYGLSLEDFDRMWLEQDQKCKICRSDNPIDKVYVDHCHATGKIRGLLCNRCNLGLGLYRDSPEILQRASDYLTEFK